MACGLNENTKIYLRFFFVRCKTDKSEIILKPECWNFYEDGSKITSTIVSTKIGESGYVLVQSKISHNVYHHELTISQ